MKYSACTFTYRLSLWSLLLFVFLPACTQDNYKKMRMAMVQTQIIDRGIEDKNVINAMLAVERHLFVPDEFVHNAYKDGPLPIGYGQTISQPYIVAYMTEVLDLSPADKVLEVGTGSGYQAAVLGELCDSVFSIEIVPELGIQAKKLLEELGYSGVFVRIGDGYKGWSEYAPFDAIIVTCAPTHIPAELIKQLKDGGRMIIPVGEKRVQQLVVLEKIKGKIKEKAVFPVLFVPMLDEEGNLY